MRPQALWRWKHDHPEVRQKLQQARQDCRIRYIERIEKFADGTGAVALRAATWLAERVFPGDYAKTQRERWACETAQEQRDRNEEREVGNAIWAEKEAVRNAEARAKKAAEAEAAKQAAAAHADLQNVKNSDEAVLAGDAATPFKEPGRPRPEVPPEVAASNSGRGRPDSLKEATPAESLAFFSAYDLHDVKNPGRPDAGPLMEVIFGPRVTDLQNVKNAGPSRAG